jgi:hypothetical protein
MRFTSRTTTSLAAEFTPGEDAALGIIADATSMFVIDGDRGLVPTCDD